MRLPGIKTGGYSGAWQLAWQAPYVYVAVAAKGLYIVDASDPTAPFVADRNTAPGPVPPSRLGGYRVGPLFAMGNHLVLSSMGSGDGWSSVDISNPVQPVLMDKVPRLPKYYSICFDGSRVYSAPRGSDRMAVYDLSDPGSFSLVTDQYRTVDKHYCATQDTFLFQGGSNAFHKIDVSDDSAYTMVGEGRLGRFNAENSQILPMGNLVYVGDDHGAGSAFVVHDVEPDETPPEVVAVSPRDGATGQAVTSRVGVAFSDLVLLESATTESIRLVEEDGDVVAGMYSVHRGIVNFAPASPLQRDSSYTVEVVAGGVRDYAGNAVAATFRSTFSTAPKPAPSVEAAGIAPETLEAEGLVGEEAAFTAVAEDCTGCGNRRSGASRARCRSTPRDACGWRSRAMIGWSR